MKSNNSKEEIIVKLMFILIFIFLIIPLLFINPIIFIILVLPTLIIYYTEKRAKKKVIRESLSPIDFKNNKEYYRDILKNHTPIELSYIDNFEINYPKDIIATLLSLQQKNKIEIKDNYINVIDNDVTNLYKSEIYILNNIKDGKVKNIEKYEVLGYAKEEALENKTIIKNKVKVHYEKGLTIETIFLIDGVLLIILTIGLVFFNQQIVDFLNNVVVPNISIIMPFIIAFILVIIAIRFFRLYKSVKNHSYTWYKSRSYKRTEEGEVLNRKIEGLKNYLKDFSLLTEREQQELVLWEEYLIYSVIFNINHKIIKELSSLIETIH